MKYQDMKRYRQSKESKEAMCALMVFPEHHKAFSEKLHLYDKNDIDYGELSYILSEGYLSAAQSVVDEEISKTRDDIKIASSDDFVLLFHSEEAVKAEIRLCRETGRESRFVCIESEFSVVRESICRKAQADFLCSVFPTVLGKA